MQVWQGADKENSAGHLEAYTSVQYADLYYVST